MSPIRNDLLVIQMNVLLRLNNSIMEGPRITWRRDPFCRTPRGKFFRV